MRNKVLFTARGLSSAAVLVLAGLAIAWLCVRTAVVAALPPGTPAVVQIAPNSPDAILETATLDLVRRRGLLDAATLAAVRRAALAAPLDARAFLILGHQQLLDGRPIAARATLEAGERLDPRQRLIHLLLADRYLRTDRFDDAAEQFSLLARLVGSARGPIADAMAKMSLTPETREAMRRTLGTDPRLEREVLVALARSNTAPDALFALASPAAQRDAHNTDSWGPALVARLIDQRQYDAARQVWRRVYRPSASDVGATIVNAQFRREPISSMFDWKLTGSGMGAADIRNASLAVDYYGRDNGDLASQLLVLRPGRYRFGFIVDPGKTDTSPHLFWTLACAPDGRTALMDVPVTATATQRRVGADVVVPAGCPAQTLRLRGESAEFPTQTSVTLRDLTLQPLAGGRP